MRYVIAMILLAIGVVLLGVAGVAYLQLTNMASQPNAPNLDDYPALQMVAGDLLAPALIPQQGVSAKPAEIVGQVVQRTQLVGFGGIVVAVLGLMVFAVWPKPQHREGT